MTDHLDFNQIKGYAQKRLSPEETKSCRDHLEGCPLCRRVLSQTVEFRLQSYALTNVLHPERFGTYPEALPAGMQWLQFKDWIGHTLRCKTLWASAAVAGVLIIFLVRSANVFTSRSQAVGTDPQPPQISRVFDQNDFLRPQYRQYVSAEVVTLLEQKGSGRPMYRDEIDPNAPSAGDETADPDLSQLTLRLKSLDSHVVTSILSLQGKTQGKPSPQFPVVRAAISFQKIDAQTQRPFGEAQVVEVDYKTSVVLSGDQLPAPGIYDCRIRLLLRGKLADFCPDSLPVRLVVQKPQSQEQPVLMGAAFVLAGELDRAEQAFQQYRRQGEQERSVQDVARADRLLAQVQHLKDAQRAQGASKLRR